METIKDILDNGGTFELSETKYNAVLCNPETIKREGGEVIYRVYVIDAKTNTAWGTNTNAWGRTNTYKLNTSDLKPY